MKVLSSNTYNKYRGFIDKCSEYVRFVKSDKILVSRDLSLDTLQSIADAYNLILHPVQDTLLSWKLVPSKENEFSISSNNLSDIGLVDNVLAPDYFGNQFLFHAFHKGKTTKVVVYSYHNSRISSNFVRMSRLKNNVF